MLFPFDTTPSHGPAETLVYAVGDIHGRSDLLRQMMKLICNDVSRSRPDSPPVLIFLGDYIDRGPDSRRVIDELLTLRADPTFSVVTLRGNHEQFLLNFIDLESSGGAAGWLDHGGRDTFASYGIEAPLRRLAPDETRSAASRLKEAIPADHQLFLRQTAFSARYGSYVFVHAGVRPGRSLDRQTPEDMMTIREPFLRSQRPLKNTVVVFGHTIFERPFQSRWKIGLDTGAYVTGRLTALRLDGKSRAFLST